MIIPDGIISIGEEAFRNCPKLTSITIPASVTEICPVAFYYLSGIGGLTSATFEITEGWYSDNTAIPAADMADLSKAARYLTSSSYLKRI